MTNILDLQNVATQVRRDIVRMTNAVNSGHPGGSLGCTEFMTALFFDIMAVGTLALADILFVIVLALVSPTIITILYKLMDVIKL